MLFPALLVWLSQPLFVLGGAPEVHKFQTEVERMLGIIINSIYPDRQIFLRELISNAADALEVVRFKSVGDLDYMGESRDLEIKLEHDVEKRTITISDTGVGMTKAQLIENLGTIAKSGTTGYLEDAITNSGGDAASPENNLIGQFGVGFYSVFLVADLVKVSSRGVDNKQHIWVSSADGSFSVEEDLDGEPIYRGTRIEMHLKEDCQEFLDEARLKGIIAKYSQFIQFPIYQKVTKEVPLDDEEKDENEKPEDEGEDNLEGKKMTQIVQEWEQVNVDRPIWLREQDTITEEEYNEFYKGISKDMENPLARSHFSAEGEFDFKSILFIPKRAPYQMLDNYGHQKADIKLFVRRVLVAEKFEDLLPKYLAFVRGIVDSNDLPLNVNRDTLQHSKIFKVINKKLIKKALDMFTQIIDEGTKALRDLPEQDADDKEMQAKLHGAISNMNTFYQEYSAIMKMGCYEDDANRAKLVNMLRFETSTHSKVRLSEVVARMAESQESIYFMSGPDKEALLRHPALQIFLQKGIEVVLFIDQLDEGCIQRLHEFEGKKFVSIQKANLDLDETPEEKKYHQRLVKFYDPLTKWILETLQKSLGAGGVLANADLKIGKVEVSKRLVSAPCTIVTSSYGYSAYQEKLLKAQQQQNRDSISGMSTKTMEINPNHPVIQELLMKVKMNPEDEEAIESINILLQTSALQAGFELADYTPMVDSLYRMMAQNYKMDPNAEPVKLELPEEEPEEEVNEEEAIDLDAETPVPGNDEL